MNEERFWGLIGASLISSAGDRGKQVAWLESQLELLSAEDILEFFALIGDQQGLCSSTRFWAVFAELTDSVSDDRFQDFQSWLISQGRDFFMGAVKSPESLLELKARHAPGIDNAFEFEEFYYICASVYEKKTGNFFWDKCI